MVRIRLSDGYHFLQGQDDFKHLVWKHMGNDAADYLEEYFREYDPDSEPAFEYEKCVPECEKIQEIQSKIESFFGEIDTEIRKIYTHEMSKKQVDTKTILLVNQAMDTVKILRKQVKKLPV